MAGRLSPLPLPSLWKNTRDFLLTLLRARARSSSQHRVSRSQFARHFVLAADAADQCQSRRRYRLSENRMLFTFASGKTRGVCRVVRGELKNKQRRQRCWPARAWCILYRATGRTIRSPSLSADPEGGRWKCRGQSIRPHKAVPEGA